MKRTIPASRHHPWPPMIPRLWHNKQSIGRRIIFTESCLYDLPGTEDDEDVNKLFGIGYFPGHHIDSARFGWFYDVKTFHLSLCHYCYVNGIRKYAVIGAASINKPYDFSLKIENGVYDFLVKETETGIIAAEAIVFTRHDKKWSYPLGLFFGGNNPAPHKMTFHISKIKV